MGCYVRQVSLCLLTISVLSSGLNKPPNATIFGPPFATSFFNQLKQSFALSYSSNISYVPISQITNEDIDAHLSAGDPVLVNSLSAVNVKATVIPMFGFSIAVVHSVPVFGLNLTQGMLLDIFLGRIRDWNHTDLASLNANLTAGLTSAPITMFSGALTYRVLEAMSIIANRTLVYEDIVNNTYVAEFVCPNVKATPNSIGFAWLGDALEQNSQIASLMNKDGFFVLPTMGVASAVSEFFTAQRYDQNTSITPHNMPGRFSWPIIGILYLILPSNFQECAKLVVIQKFVSLVMFQTSNMDLLARALGWEPIKSSNIFDYTLGKVISSQDYHDTLFSLDCSQKQTTNYHTLGTSSQLATSILRALTSYTGTEYANIRMLSADHGINDYLNAMLPSNTSLVDMSFTWVPLLKNYPQLIPVPVYMGGVVVFVNLPNITVVLDRHTLVGIFSRKITYWNDSQIKALNKEVDLPFHIIYVLGAADDTIADGSTAAFSKWLQNASSNFTWSQARSTLFTPKESDIRRYVNYFQYSIGYGFSQEVVNASENIAQLIGFDGEPIAFSSRALAECWRALDGPKCWPMAIPLAMVLQQPTDCAHQQPSVAFVDWLLRKGTSIHPFLVPNPDTSNKLGSAEFCAGRSLLRTIPEPQTVSVGVKAPVQVLAVVGMILAIMQAVALGISRKRSELKSASVLFSLLAVVGVFLILAAPLMIVQDNPAKAACGSSIWFLCIGYTLCYGSLFAKLFRLYMIFTTRKLVVPRLSNRKLLWMVFAFLVVDVILLVVYTAVTPAEPFEFSAEVSSPDDYVTGLRKFTLVMCAFNVDSPVLHIILIFKCAIALGGAVMAFFIRQVDRRFTAISALGWSFYNMFITVVIAIIISLAFDPKQNLQTAIIVPVFCGLWIMYVTLCALTLDSNVLLACKDFSQPLRRLLNSGKSKDSKDTVTVSKNSAEKDLDPESLTKQSHSSTMFVVNREMFPSKYDDFNAELLERILQELNFQRMAVRRVISSAVPGHSTGLDTGVELSPINGDWRRSTRVDSSRLNSKSRAGLAPLSVDVFNGTSSPAATPVANTPRDGPPEQSIDSPAEVSDLKLGDLKSNGPKLSDLKPSDPRIELSDPKLELSDSRIELSDPKFELSDPKPELSDTEFGS